MEKGVGPRVLSYLSKIFISTISAQQISQPEYGPIKIQPLILKLFVFPSYLLFLDEML